MEKIGEHKDTIILFTEMRMIVMPQDTIQIYIIYVCKWGDIYNLCQFVGQMKKTELDFLEPIFNVDSNYF